MEGGTRVVPDWVITTLEELHTKLLAQPAVGDQRKEAAAVRQAIEALSHPIKKA